MEIKSSWLVMLFFSMTAFAPPGVEVLFRSSASSRGKIKRRLLNLMVREQKRIIAAMYCFTDREIADQLLRRARAGVKVDLIVDQASFGGDGQGEYLRKQGLKFHCYSRQRGTLHAKMAAFEGEQVFWNGSYNFTTSAARSNDECVTIVHDQGAYLEGFKFYKTLLGQACVRLVESEEDE